MEKKKDMSPTKQCDLTDWLNSKNGDINIKGKTKESKNKDSSKPKLAFGYGYNPKILTNGIKEFKFSHEVDTDIKLYEFQPKLSYRIFNELGKVLKYNCFGNELRKDNTIIKNDYFITDIDPNDIIKMLNKGIKQLFETYEPSPFYDVKSKQEK